MPTRVLNITRLIVVLTLLVLSALATRSLGAQAAPPGRLSVPLYLQGGLPQGDFAENVDFAGGLGGGVLFEMVPELALRAELGFLIYGNETRRVPLGGGALGLINVDVTTTNSIFHGGVGLQLGTPGQSIKPYVGGLLGFSSFTTSSRVAGTNSNDEPFASSTNSSDGVFAKTALVGLYVPMGGSLLLDLGVRHTWNGDRVRYLTRGDITEDAGGNVVLTPRETRADLLTITLGVTLRPGRSR
jgi:hypothetical protein